jgi:hypothetical protein
MPNNVLKISSYSIKGLDTFFFDNNIWMYIFCPLGNYQKDKRQNVYSKFFSYALSRNSHIFTNALILSEFSNRFLRLDYNLARDEPINIGKMNDYKRDYVGTPRFVSTVADVKHCLTKIISVCQKSSDEFNSINIGDVLTSFIKIGFNDSYYIQLASTKRWIIVSDDSDFSRNKIPDKNLTILTI